MPAPDDEDGASNKPSETSSKGDKYSKRDVHVSRPSNFERITLLSSLVLSAGTCILAVFTIFLWQEAIQADENAKTASHVTADLAREAIFFQRASQQPLLRGISPTLSQITSDTTFRFSVVNLSSTRAQGTLVAAFIVGSDSDKTFPLDTLMAGTAPLDTSQIVDIQEGPPEVVTFGLRNGQR